MRSFPGILESGFGMQFGRRSLQFLSSSTQCPLAELFFSDSSVHSPPAFVLGLMQDFLMLFWADFGAISGLHVSVAGLCISCGCLLMLAWLSALGLPGWAMTLLALVAHLPCQRLLDTVFGYALMLRQYGELYAFYYPVLEFAKGFVTWGAVSWLLQFLGPHLFFEGEDSDPVFLLDSTTSRSGQLWMIPRAAHAVEDQLRETIFPTIASITLWCIWKARCMHVLSATPSTPLDTLRIFWSELIHTLRSQWDASQGDSRAAEERRFAFLRSWGRTSMLFHSTSGTLIWHYALPEWIIMQASHQPP